MEMIPAAPYGTRSKAELRVFDLLRYAFRNDPSWTAYHSLNLPWHPYKRFGEIDFLLCGAGGLYVLEIKGGRVSCKDGLWRYQNRYSETTPSIEGPFRQAESALHGLVSKLNSDLPVDVVSQFILGYGIIFPDIEWNMRGTEWDNQIIADIRGIRNFEGWLQTLFHYWANKAGHFQTPEKDALRSLKYYLRPRFDVAVPLFQLANQVEEKITSLTNDQMVMVDVVQGNPRVLCSGGAGTGKTFLALELARRWTALGAKVLLACRSRWLKRYLESLFVMSGLTISLSDAVQTALNRNGNEHFDVLVVDEGQDVMDMTSLHQFDLAIRGGLENGRWCIFFDLNNQAGLLGSVDHEAWSYLENIHSTKVPLTTNCRNTHAILKKVKSVLGADMGIRGAGEGPAVREHGASSREASAKLLAGELFEIIDEGGIAAGSVTLLSPLPYHDSSAALLPDSIRHKITLLDEYALRSFPVRQTGFAQIPNFKGLENEAVIITDLMHPKQNTIPLSMHYVAMSRARAILSIIYRSDL